MSVKLKATTFTDLCAIYGNYGRLILDELPENALNTLNVLMDGREIAMGEGDPDDIYINHLYPFSDIRGLLYGRLDEEEYEQLDETNTFDDYALEHEEAIIEYLEYEYFGNFLGRDDDIWWLLV